MKVLIACEESQAVTIEFRKLGVEAYSCDIVECSGGHPEWHIKGDVLKYLDGLYVCKCGNLFEGGLGKYGCCDVSKLITWNMMIAFPPCTHLAVSGAAWFEQKRKDGSQQGAIDFFMELVNAPIAKIAIENPVGIMSTNHKKPSQIIQPFYFGDAVKKTTCLWLKELNPLFHAKGKDLFNDTITHVLPELLTMQSKKTGKVRTYSKWEYEASCKQDNRKEIRSKTFVGIAKAMAAQWS